MRVEHQSGLEGVCAKGMQFTGVCTLLHIGCRMFTASHAITSRPERAGGRTDAGLSYKNDVTKPQLYSHPMLDIALCCLGNLYHSKRDGQDIYQVLNESPPVSSSVPSRSRMMCVQCMLILLVISIEKGESC